MTYFCFYYIFFEKHDIREAPSSIRDSYKMYYKLKSSFLEETLGDALEDDSFDLSILESSSSQMDSTLSASLSELSTPDVSALTSDTSVILSTTPSTLATAFEVLSTKSTLSQPDSKTNSKSNEFDAEISSSLNEKAWGEELNNKFGAPKNSLNDSGAGSNLRKSMSDKLFRNSSFIKRNPRKSLSRNSLSGSQSSQSLASNSQREMLPDLETLLAQKSQQMKEKEDETESTDASTVNDVKKPSTNLANNFDQEWLNRCNLTNNLDDASTPLQSNKSVEQTRKFGISNINSNALATFVAKQLSSMDRKTTLSIDMTNLNLKSADSLIKNDSALKTGQIDSNDDEVENSEDESEKRNAPLIRSIRHVNKRKHSDLDKTQCEKVAKLTDDNDFNKNSNTLKDDERIIEKPQKKVNRKTEKVTVKRKTAAKNDDTNRKVAIAKRTTSRVTRQVKSYAEQKLDDSSSEKEADPFEGDGSDTDPNFDVGKEKSKRKQNQSKDSDSSDGIDSEEKTVAAKTVAAKKVKVVRKRVIRVENGIRPKAKPKTMPKTSRKSNVKPVEKPDDVENEETPDDFIIEFGMENIKSVPRMPVGELKQSTEQFTKFVYNADTATSSVNGETDEKSVKTKPLALKTSMAKEKLEKRIASGTLDENYVRLNLRKKVFVRGKKTINFSRYKKKLWKTKKAAALSGPDMDMGGCDGGILTCFQCGMPGHFAQNCKIKSKYSLLLYFGQCSV